MAKSFSKKTSKSGKGGSSLTATMDHFRKREFAPVYLVYGNESFLVDELQRVLLATALEPHEKDFNLDILYGADVDASQVVALAASYPMMAQRRVVIVRDLEKIKPADSLVAYAENPNPSSVVLLVCRGKPNMSTNPYRALKKVTVAVEATTLRDYEIPKWIVTHMKGSGHTIDPRAAQMLGDYVGTDLQTVVGEVDKLITFVGERKEITLDDVIAASGQTREINAFELQKAIGAGNYRKAAGITEQLLRQSSNPAGEALRSVAILTAYFSKLRILTNCQSKGVPKAALAKRIGVNPYFVQDYVGSLRYYGSTALENALSTLLAADYELKGGTALDPNMIMSLTLRRIMVQ